MNAALTDLMSGAVGALADAHPGGEDQAAVVVGLVIDTDDGTAFQFAYHCLPADFGVMAAGLLRALVDGMKGIDPCPSCHALVDRAEKALAILESQPTDIPHAGGLH